MKKSNNFSFITFSVLIFIHSVVVLYIFKFRFGDMKTKIAFKTLNEQFELKSQDYTSDELREACRNLGGIIESTEAFNLFLIEVIGKIGLFWSISLPIIAITFFFLGRSRSKV